MLQCCCALSCSHAASEWHATVLDIDVRPMLQTHKLSNAPALPQLIGRNINFGTL